MIVRSFRVQNFKCFRDSGTIALENGFNIFVGQNNSGKSTLLQALKLVEFNKPHKSSAIDVNETLNPDSLLELRLEFSAAEFQSFVLKHNIDFILRESSSKAPGAGRDSNETLNLFLSSGDITTQVVQGSTTGTRAMTPPLHSKYGILSGDRHFDCRPSPDRKSINVVGSGSGATETVTGVGKQIFDSSTFHFDAQRVSLGRCGYGESTTLTSNAANLARAMLELNETPSLQSLLNKHLEEIIPSIKWVVAANPAGTGQVEIRTCAYPQELARKELLIPLNESGTGVGQVLAILFAAITFQEPKIILIDEPNSFLHPGAAKRLIEVLKQYDRHQYILTTHSAEIIAAAEPATLHRTRWIGTESIVETLDRKSMQNLEGMLADLGVTMSDVFGANAILWVEGMTEQLCFPKLLKAANDPNEAHIKPIALKDVGQFDKAKVSAGVLWDAYEKLCKADALMPPTVAFCLDREGRKQKEIDEISTLSGRRMKFLPRRNYESFLLHSKAISEALSQIPFDEPVDISEMRIAQIFSELGTDKNFHAAKYWKGDVYDADWLERVDGASLLKAIFAKVAPGKAVYQKTAHSVFLTEWLIANDPNHIKELIGFVSSSAKTKFADQTSS